MSKEPLYNTPSRSNEPIRHHILSVLVQKPPRRAGRQPVRRGPRRVGAELASVVVGDTVSSRYGKALYARRNGEDQCWQVTGKLAPSADPTGWVVKDILKIASERVESARILH
ncbi:MAG: DUF4340 domain-containing protein, partial [Phyllobacteriaceae bacterium]|nr:DUF4340 domain-containing protein [Phyllobacteriaceae bacterium]